VDQVNNPWLRSFDVSLAGPTKLKRLGKRGALVPSFNVFNLFNFGFFSTLNGCSKVRPALASRPLARHLRLPTPPPVWIGRRCAVAGGPEPISNPHRVSIEFSVKLSF
jgi:hypothetical protein